MSILAKENDIIQIKDDYDAYGMLAGEVYIVGIKNEKLVALPKRMKNQAGLDVDDPCDYDIIGDIFNNKDLIPIQYHNDDWYINMETNYNNNTNCKINADLKDRDVVKDSFNGNTDCEINIKW